MLRPIILMALAHYGHRATEQIKENIRNKPVTLRGVLKTYTQPVNASGQSAESIKMALDEGAVSLTITGRKFIGTIEYGRKPGAISREGFEQLKRWMQSRGIEPGAAWAIKKSIEQKGTLMRQQMPAGSKILDVFSAGPVNIEDFKRQLSEQMVPALTSSILQQWQA